jgi:hypothetical protein
MTAGLSAPSSPDMTGLPAARSMTMNARPRPASGPPDAHTNGVGKAAAATARCMIVSFCAVTGPGISRAARRRISAQKPPRMIREYHTMRLLPPPERRGRLGLYGIRHVQRLEFITRLQRRGYSLAGIWTCWGRGRAART